MEKKVNAAVKKMLSLNLVKYARYPPTLTQPTWQLTGIQAMVTSILDYKETGAVKYKTV